MAPGVDPAQTHESGIGSAYSESTPTELASADYEPPPESAAEVLASGRTYTVKPGETVTLRWQFRLAPLAAY